MTEIARWNGHIFEVSSDVIRGFTGLSITGGSDTEDAESQGQKYVSRKNGKPKQVVLTASLNAHFGCDVQAEAMTFVDESTSGSKDYFYIGGKKLMECSLMLVQAEVSEVSIAPGGAWIKADAKLTFKQCSKNDGSASSGGASSGAAVKKESVKQTQPKVPASGKFGEVFPTVVKSAESSINQKYNGLMDATLAIAERNTRIQAIKKIEAAEAAKEKTFASRWVVEAARSDSQKAEERRKTSIGGAPSSKITMISK